MIISFYKAKHLELITNCALIFTEKCQIPGEYQCESGLCIPSYLRCNGNEDCPDGTDELDCPPGKILFFKSKINSLTLRISSVACKVDEFKCDSGLCVRLDQKCDGNFDCPDRSDENGCLPGTLTFETFFNTIFS